MFGVVRCTTSPFAWSKTLERIGNVVRVLTTFCTCCKPSSNFSFVTLNFMRSAGADGYDVRLTILFGNRNLLVSARENVSGAGRRKEAR